VDLVEGYSNSVQRGKAVDSHLSSQ